MANQKKGYLADDRLAAFCRDTAMLLEANIPLYLGYEDIYGEGGGFADVSAVAEVREAVRAGERLSTALRRTGVFPGYLCDMTATGEKSGRLDDVMRQLSGYYERRDEFRRRMRSAVVYPVLLLCMMTVVVAVLIFTVLPVFSEVLSRFDYTAAAGTDAVMRTSTVLCTVILALLVLALLLGAAGLLLSRSERGAKFLRRVLEHFGPTRRLSYDIAASHLVSGLAALLASGFSTEEALSSLLATVEHPQLRARVEKAVAELKAGEPQGKALIDAGIFGTTDNQLITVAARTGSLDTAASQLARRYDARVTDALDRVAAILEPSLIAFLTLVIGAVMLSVMLPLIRILSSIG